MNDLPLDKVKLKKDGEPFIQVNGLSKTYGMNHKRVEALKDLTFDIIQGESAAIMGDSGAGKSTLLHILGTLDHPTSGNIAYRGKDVFSLNEKHLADFRNHTIGFIFQFHYLLPEFNALENTMMPALIRGYKKDEALEEAEKLLLTVGLKDRLTHKQGELSGGEQQRVAIARALILKPEIILADEPIGNLDSKTGEAVFDLLLSLNRQLKITLLVVTHNESLAHKIPRRITLRDGRIVAPQDLPYNG
jgi:lipoprotein-releasing system ATP-binding protein